MTKVFLKVSISSNVRFCLVFTFSNNSSNILKERLRDNREWVKSVAIYRHYIYINKRAEVELFKERPIICMINFIYFIPIKLLDIFTNMKREYNYSKVIKRMEVIEREIRLLEKH